MLSRTLQLLVGVCILAGMAGCSAAGSPAAGSSSTRPPGASTHAGNACDRHLVTKDDLTGILKDPIVTMKSLAADGDGQTCVFETAGYSSVTITLRPGFGDVTVGTWASGRMPMPAEPLIGVGDHAVWSRDLKEVIATKNDLLCDIGVGGPAGAMVDATVVRRRLGDLCNTIYAKQ